MRVIASDFHFGRNNYDSSLGQQVKRSASQNVADFLSEQTEKPTITVVGDLFHRPHWSPEVARQNKEGFNRQLSDEQIGPLSEELRKGYQLTLIDGNCDPWMSMPNDQSRNIHNLLLDGKKKITVIFRGLGNKDNGLLFTHGHLAEEAGLLARRALQFSANGRVQSKANDLDKTLEDQYSTIRAIAEHDEAGSSLFHHIVCQTLLRIEKLEIAGLDAVSPARYVRKIGNETIASVIAQSDTFDSVRSAFFGHTHQVLRSEYEDGTVWNSGSATGDLHSRPYGTFLTEDKGVVTPYYSWHPDNPKAVVQMPESHIQEFNKGMRGRRKFRM